MRVLVTGAGGFVGRHIVNALIAQRHEVIALDRRFDDDLILRWGSAVKPIVADALDLPQQPVDAIVHAAALTAQPEELGMTPEAHLRANFDPALRILEWAGEHAAHARVILISSSAVFGDGSPYGKAEGHSRSPLGTYAIAKAALECVAATWRDEYQRDVVCVRLSSVYGEGEIARETRPRISLVSRYIHQALTERRIRVTEPSFQRDWTYAPDIGAAVVRILTTNVRYSLYNVAAQQILTSLEVAEYIRRLLPEVKIVMDESAATNPLIVQRGYLINERIDHDLGFHHWTPFVDGLANVIAAARHRLEVQA